MEIIILEVERQKYNPTIATLYCCNKYLVKSNKKSSNICSRNSLFIREWKYFCWCLKERKNPEILRRFEKKIHFKRKSNNSVHIEMYLFGIVNNLSEIKMQEVFIFENWIFFSKRIE